MKFYTINQMLTEIDPYRMDFVSSGRFPRALPQPPRYAAGSSTNANPAGVAAFHCIHTYREMQSCTFNSIVIKLNNDLISSLILPISTIRIKGQGIWLVK